MKKSILPAVLAMAVLTGGVAFAAPGDANHSADRPVQMKAVAAYHHPGMEMANLSPEKRKEIGEVMKQYAPKLGELRDRIQVKRLEMNALSRNANVSEKSITEAARALERLMAEQRTLRQERNDKLETITGFPFFMGKCPGQCWDHPRGRHGGYHHYRGGMDGGPQRSMNN